MPEGTGERPLVGATMFGVTTPCVTHARERLEELGYEVLVFHATGTGGQSFEALATGGFLVGALDATTTELADDLVGGVLSAGPDRLEAVGRAGIPQVVSLGALDMVNFGPRDTVPPQFEGRNLYVHNPTITLMRTTPEEMAELGRRIARKLNGAAAPTVLFVPLKGVSAIDVEGQPFHDAEADEALFAALREGVDPGKVEVHEVDADVNDPAFADAMADRLHELIQEARMTRDEALARLREQVAQGRPVIGAGAGTGLSAKCAQDGGADLIIIYNSGRYRMAGRGSLAGMMPYGDANAIVMDMAREVLPVARDTPVLAGVCGTDPVPPHAELPRGRQARGLHRRAELPHRRAHRRDLPRRPGGDRHGLRPRGRDDPRGARARPAHRALRLRRGRGAGDGRGGRRRARPAHGPDHRRDDRLALGHLARRGRRARAGAAATRRATVNPDILCLCHGGPIAEPDDARYVLERTTGIVGFFGASSMERLPTEVAMTENMRRFKSIPIQETA